MEQKAQGPARVRLITMWLVLGCVFVFQSPSLPAAETLDTGRLDKIAAALREKPRGFGHPIRDRAAWEVLASKPSFRRVIGQAEDLLARPIPEQPDDLYLDFSRTGNRSRWQRVSGRRRGRITTLALAECLENKGRFVPAFEEIVHELCSERTWVMPAHDSRLTNFNGTSVDIDLGSSGLAWSLATADYLLGDKVSAETRRLVRENLDRRIFEPYQDMIGGRREKNWWLTGTNNWNAVCLAGVTGSALSVIDSPRTRAVFVLAAADYSKNFLKGFTNDGYCSEGLGYWNYGFGYYVMLSEIIYQATEGKVDLMNDPKVKQIAAFGANIEIQGGVYPAFADCSVRARPGERLMYFVSRRLGLGMRSWERLDPVSPGGGLYASMMYSFANSASRAAPAGAAYAGPGIRSWFDEAGVLICRPSDGSSSRFAVALKGGHNQEHHNHNDVGSFVVVLGRKALVLDPGGEVYTQRTFSSRRYESKVLNSFGHPVPVVAGKLQRTGGQARGQVVRRSSSDEKDVLTLDISSAYEVAELKKLERTFEYSRAGNGSLRVTDEVSFSQPRSFGTALVTFSQWKQTSGSSLTVYEQDDALDVRIEAGGADFDVQAETIDEDVSAPSQPVRIGINLREPVLSATVSIVIKPTQPPAIR